MTKTIHFNTGRKYTANGQRITATLHDDGIVTFMDHDRGVDGGFACAFPDMFDQKLVMYYYDRDMSVSNRRSLSDGRRDGCNSKWQGRN